VVRSWCPTNRYATTVTGSAINGKDFMWARLTRGRWIQIHGTDQSDPRVILPSNLHRLKGDQRHTDIFLHWFRRYFFLSHSPRPSAIATIACWSELTIRAQNTARTPLHKSYTAMMILRSECRLPITRRHRPELYMTPA
jgi:hypothetical protein